MTPEILIERAKQIANDVSSRIPEIEQRSSLPDDIVASLVDAELLATLVPKAHGGFEFDLDTVIEIVLPFAAVCPSVAWNVCFYVGATWGACQFPRECQDMYFASGPNTLIAGSQIPTFVLKPVDGGYLASGRSSWLSGAPNADFIICAGRVADDKNPPQIRSMMIPREKLNLIDTWRVEAMRATGSIDATAEELFVPHEHTINTNDLMAGGAPGAQIYPNNPLYARPAEVMTLTYILPVFVGAARGAADELLTATRQRMHTHTGTSAATKASTQAHIGRLQTQALLAEDMLRALVKSVLDANTSSLIEPLTRQMYKSRVAMIVDYCRDIVTDAARAAGANAFKTESVLQMFLRDINMISVHPFFEKDASTETYGKGLLGV